MGSGILDEILCFEGEINNFQGEIKCVEGEIRHLGCDDVLKVRSSILSMR